MNKPIIFGANVSGSNDMAHRCSTNLDVQHRAWPLIAPVKLTHILLSIIKLLSTHWLRQQELLAIKYVRRFPRCRAANSIALKLTIRIAGLTQPKFDYLLIFFTIHWLQHFQRIPIAVDSSSAAREKFK
jgi:hypothetical protein